ncbi:ubiquitin-conjugating enzyme E2 L3-like [Acomys russatus]|uniref:ubiquitin-conjugating enzyme E2 L3-like n=1 Tax=Acomys russatus TaxID=60746 RepID=UPI0021E2DB3A|nr:ubiquitin-conjugating enzyme E2 L3-like [Acomys russatus]
MAASRRLMKDNPPNDKGTFGIEINFPAEYPFKPPKISIRTKVYHPHTNEKWQVCLTVISAKNWKPPIKSDPHSTGNNSQTNHPFWAVLAEEYSKDHKKKIL